MQQPFHIDHAAGKKQLHREHGKASIPAFIQKMKRLCLTEYPLDDDLPRSHEFFPCEARGTRYGVLDIVSLIKADHSALFRTRT
ncbi:MAG: hypothetical protein MI724_08110, partial [Spirochaetales bacterium]|nr:hypothetical protein [Spirochaetales bacterium]